MIGARPADDLPQVLRGADIGLIPYAINDLTRSVFPMKVYEYLAAGLPVLATPLPALDGVEAIETVGSAEELVAVAERVLAADSLEVRRARSKGAASHSWEARLGEIEQALG
jgi:glycosyltransferase involved in cell wall biosynthesis